MSLKHFRDLLEKEKDETVFTIKVKFLKDLLDKLFLLETDLENNIYKLETRVEELFLLTHKNL